MQADRTVLEDGGIPVSICMIVVKMVLVGFRDEVWWQAKRLGVFLGSTEDVRKWDYFGFSWISL